MKYRYNISMEKYVLKTRSDGSQITVRDLQLVLLEMMKDIDAICQKNQITYLLSAGSALGAIRHKGFIPWDDDMDIAMSVDDYDRFVEVLKKELPSDKYLFHCFQTNDKYNVLIPAMKIRKRNTYVKEVNTLLENRCKEEGKDSDGVFIDVFIYDSCSKNKVIDLPFRLFNILLMPIIVLVDNIGINPKFLKRCFVNNARLYGRLNEKSNYTGFDLTWTFRSPLRPYMFKKNDIYPVRYVEFEDTKLPVANNTHAYLCAIFNDSYMQFPDVKHRFAKHTVDIEI